MWTILIILMAVLVQYFIVKVKFKIISALSIFLLPIVPSVYSIWVEAIELNFMLEFLKTGSFVLSLLSVPVIMWLIMVFVGVYSFTTLLLFIELKILCKLELRKLRKS